MMSSITPDRYDLVCQSAQGAVQRCRCCAAIRVRFGNMLLGLDAEGFQTFCDAIAADRRGHVHRNLKTPVPRGLAARTRGATGTRPAEESIFYLDDSGLGFVLTRAEIEELDDLLQHACLLIALPTWATTTRAAQVQSHDTVRGGRWNA